MNQLLQDLELVENKKETNEEAVKLLASIKDRFEEVPEIYENFLQIIRDLGQKRFYINGKSHNHIWNIYIYIYIYIYIFIYIYINYIHKSE